MNGLTIGCGIGTGQDQVVVAPVAACALASTVDETGEIDADSSTHRITRRQSRVGQAAANGDNTCTACGRGRVVSRVIREPGK